VAAAVGSPAKQLLMSTLECMEKGEDFLCGVTCLLVLVTRAPESSSGKSLARVMSGMCLPEQWKSNQNGA